MNASTNGMDVTAKVVELARDYMLVEHCGSVYHIDFNRYPYFRSCFLGELYHVEASPFGLHWPDADIDLEVEYIKNPPEKCNTVDLEWWKAQRKRVLSRLGAIGGGVKSPRKASASRANGAKGGRPKKKKELVLA